MIKISLKPILIGLVFFMSIGLIMAEIRQWQGKLRIIGNEPFTCLCLRDSQGEWELTGPLSKILRSYQGNRVKVRGTMLKEPIGFGGKGKILVDEAFDSEGKPLKPSPLKFH